MYDTSKKQRIPSWTDRILYRPVGPQVTLLAYDSVPSMQTSDHRPVYAAFHVELRGAGRKPGEAGEATIFGGCLLVVGV